MDIFEKCYAPSLAKDLQEKGVYPYFQALQSRQDVEVMMEGKRRIMLGSNNYLGLTTDPEVIEAGMRAMEQFGTGCSGSRFLNGTLELHLELEEALASFLHKDRGRHLRHGLSVQCGHHQRPGGPARLCDLRPGKPRLYLCRLPDELRQDAALPPQRHGGPGKAAAGGCRSRTAP